MTKKLRKTLPKDFDALIEAGDLTALKAVFDACELDATGGYSKVTALSFFKVPEALTRWLVEKGARLDAMDRWGNTPLHAQAQSYAADLTVFISLGADVNANTSSSGTPLHVAASAPHPHNVKALLAAGAKVDVMNRDGLTALDWALQRGNNAALDRLSAVTQLLVDAGAKPSSRTAGFVTRLGETFEFHRAGFNRDLLDVTEAGLRTLYTLFNVTPVPQRVLHDGKSRIQLKSKSLQDQHQELWELLVPSSGAAKTVQGEVTRIAGRVHSEFRRNGGANWDDEYRKMCDAFQQHVNADAALIKRIKTGRASDEDLDALVVLSVKWVLANPEPVPLGDVSYRR